MQDKSQTFASRTASKTIEIKEAVTPAPPVTPLPSKFSLTRRQLNLFTIFRPLHIKRKFRKAATAQSQDDIAKITTGASDALQELFRGDTTSMDSCEIPNANFAKKFEIFTEAVQLPTTIKELPVAEDKALDNRSNSFIRGEFLSVSTGRFTPQLWFDGGLDDR